LPQSAYPLQRLARPGVISCGGGDKMRYGVAVAGDRDRLSALHIIEQPGKMSFYFRNMNFAHCPCNRGDLPVI
jgi:hypothetical protein